MADLILAAAAAGGAYVVSLKLWPYTTCSRCGGSSTNAGSNRKRWGDCRKCGGSGKRLRAGARLLRR